MYNRTGAKREVRAGAGPPPGTEIPNCLAAPVGCRLSSAVVSAADHVDHAIFFPWAEAPSGFGSCMFSNTHNHLDAFFSFFFFLLLFHRSLLIKTAQSQVQTQGQLSSSSRAQQQCKQHWLHIPHRTSNAARIQTNTGKRSSVLASWRQC